MAPKRKRTVESSDSESCKPPKLARRAPADDADDVQQGVQKKPAARRAKSAPARGRVISKQPAP